MIFSWEGSDKERERNEEWRDAVDYLGGEELAARTLERRFPNEKLPDAELPKFFAWQLVRSTGGNVNDYFKFIATRDRYDLLQAFGLFRTEHYLALEPRD